MPKAIRHHLANKAQQNHRTVSAEILYRLERSVEADVAQEQLASHLRRALTARQRPMAPDEVVTWAEQTFDRLEGPARQK